MAPSLYHALSTGKLNWAGTNAPELKLFYYLLWYAFGQSQVAPSLMMSVHTLENSTDQELLSIEDMYEAIVCGWGERRRLDYLNRSSILTLTVKMPQDVPWFLLFISTEK